MIIPLPFLICHFKVWGIATTMPLFTTFTDTEILCFQADIILHLFLTHLSNVLHPPENQTHCHARDSCHKKQQCRSRTFSAAKQNCQNASLRRCLHQRFKNLIHQQPTAQISKRDCKKLKCISYRIHAPLHLSRNPRSENHIHVRIHKRNKQPPKDCPDTPDQRAFTKCKHKVFRAHRKQQAITDHPDSVFWRGKQGHNHAPSKCRNSHAGIDRSKHLLILHRQNHCRQRCLIDRGNKIDCRQKQHQPQNTLVCPEIIDPFLCCLQDIISSVAL